MTKTIVAEMELPDDVSEEAIKAFLEDAIGNALISPAGTPMWSIKGPYPSFKVMEVS